MAIDRFGKVRRARVVPVPQVTLTLHGELHITWVLTYEEGIRYDDELQRRASFFNLTLYKPNGLWVSTFK